MEYICDSAKAQGVITEKRAANQPGKYTVGDSLDIRFKAGKADVISETEYAAQKKNLIIYPCAFLGCVVLVCVLVPPAAKL